ncbi:hypothetical protein H5410_050879, partial [Solanum commersonii]
HTRKISTIANDRAQVNSLSDRPRLFSEVSTILTNLKCNVVNAKVWTHNTPTTAIVQVTGEETGGTINDPERFSMMKQLLCNVLRCSNKCRNSKTIVSDGVSYTERRPSRANNYSIVTIRCKDGPKLLFYTIFTLTDLQYVVFHGNVDEEGPIVHQPPSTTIFYKFRNLFH